MTKGKWLSKVVITLIMLTASSQVSADILYQTSFEASEGFVAGNIDGQNGWDTFEPTPGAPFANINFSGPAGSTGGVLQFDSGTAAASSPRYAWPSGYGSTFSSNGYTKLITENLLFMASGSTSTARLGLTTFDNTGAKILAGYYVQQNTGLVYLLANYNNAGTINNFAFNTNVAINKDQWVKFTTTWDKLTGRMEVYWGANAFYVDGAAAGSIADETDFYATRNGSTIASTVYFDDLKIEAVPEPGSLGLVLLVIAGSVATSRRRVA